MLEPQNRTFKPILTALVALFSIGLVALLIIYRVPLLTKLSNKPKPIEILVSTGTVKDGDIMTTILSQKGLPADQVTKIQNAIGKNFNLRRMKPGHNFEVMTTTSGVFQKFIYHDDPTHAYSVEASTMGALTTSEISEDTSWKQKIVTCEVKSYLDKDLRDQGYDANFVTVLIGKVADEIFPWQIDFFTEQRQGDVIQILVEQQFIVEKTPANAKKKTLPQEKPLNRMRILAARYLGKGTKRKENFAIMYKLPGATRDDYYDMDGNAIRKAFLRAPFTYANFRISSGFNPHRFHPILRVYRPHHGIDYAAAYGTRVSCIGNGRVVYAGWKGGYGNCVEVRHNGTYISRYGHLSRIGVRNGASINQGQYVGNVGNTGLSTGPHLHFEMLVNGESRNFVRMEFPSATSVPKDNMNEFARVRDDLMTRLNNGVAAQSKAQAQLPTTNQRTN